MTKKITGNIVDIFNKEIFYGAIIFENEQIASIARLPKENSKEHVPRGGTGKVQYNIRKKHIAVNNKTANNKIKFKQ